MFCNERAFFAELTNSRFFAHSFDAFYLFFAIPQTPQHPTTVAIVVSTTTTNTTTPFRGVVVVVRQVCGVAGFCFLAGIQKFSVKTANSRFFAHSFNLVKKA